MKQLISGRFEYEVPKLLLSEKQIDIQMKVSENYRGSFVMRNSSQKRMKGFIHTSTWRVQCNIFEFSDAEVNVIYEINTRGLAEGDKIKGGFKIISDVGEYELPFSISIERALLHSSNGEINSLSQFTKLASRDIKGAYQIFVSRQFRKVFRGRDRKYLSLYDGMSKLPATYQDMEEFLIGAKQKQPISLQLGENQKEYREIINSVKEVIQITKSTWGVLKIDVVVEGNFIETHKNVLVSDDFLGSVLNFEFIIKQEKLHGGKNWGRINFITCHETLTYEVIAYKEAMIIKKKKHYKLREMKVRLMNLYMQFRMGELSLEAWAEKTEVILNSLVKMGDLYRHYDLFKAQVLFAIERPEEAQEILKEFKASKKLLYTPELKAYYLYLTTLHMNEKTQIQNANEKIYHLYLQNQDSWQILWMRLNIDEELNRNSAKRLEAIAYQYKLGCRSRIMYLEAYDIFQQEPSRIKRLLEFEMVVLGWAAKEQLLVKDVVMQIVEIAARAKVFDRKIFELLCACYEKYAENAVLSAVCSMLIKGNKTNKKYFIWYEAAVTQGLRLTRLYEYYMDTLEYGHLDLLPIMIRMYFTYNNTLNYKKQAALYANIIKNRHQDEDTYLNYRNAMEQFMMEQLALGHINRDLAIVYEGFIDKAKLTEPMKETLTKTMMSYEIMCDNKRVKSIIVIHHQLKSVQIVPCVDGIATVQLFTPDYEIILQDELGRKFPATIKYYRHSLIANAELKEEYMYRDSNQVGFLLHMCDQALSKQQITGENITYLQEVLESPEIKESFKHIIMKKIILFYHENGDFDNNDVYLHCINYENFVQVDRVNFLEILIMRYMYKEAYALVKDYGYEFIEMDLLLRLASRMVQLYDFEFTEELIDICYFIYSQNKYDENILVYLTDFYEGSLPEMVNIWKAAKGFELDTRRLEEKILMLLIFARMTVKKGDEVFDSYFKHDGKPRVLLAYLTHEAYGYFIKDYKMKSLIAKYLERYYENAQEMDDVCYLALLKYYAKKEELGEQQLLYAQTLMEKYNFSGLRFAFQKDLPEEIISPYQIIDKTFVEYRTNPKHKVYLHYCLGEEGQEAEEFQVESMKNLYEGIFSKEFTLFYGDQLTYYMTEEWEDEVITSEKKVIMGMPSMKKHYQNKFERLNQLRTQYYAKDEEKFMSSIQDYVEEVYMIENIFTLM